MRNLLSWIQVKIYDLQLPVFSFYLKTFLLSSAAVGFYGFLIGVIVMGRV